ncbi:MAG: hypothetical protein ACT4PL_08175 [Phycisphaerales bacterium]
MNDPSQPEPAPNAKGASGLPNVPTPRIDAPSILKVVEEEPCPNCKGPLATSDVVCMKCGFDMVAGKVRTTATGQETAPVAAASADRTEFVVPGRGQPRVLLVAGGVVLVMAVVATGYFAPAGAGAGRSIAAMAVTLYQGFFHTATGALAVAATALGLHYKLGRVDVLIPRVFVAWSLFLLIRSCAVPLGDVHAAVDLLAVTGRWVLAMGAYWLALLFFFRRTPLETSFIGAVHGVLILLSQLATFLEALQLTTPAK